MEKKIFNILKVIAITCFVILLVEIIYIFYLSQEKSIYFDGINSIINVDDGYVAIGSNNNNDKYLEKAKITKYNAAKEKMFEKIYNKGYNGVFFDVVEDSNKNLIAVGSVEYSEENHYEGNRVGLIVKYDKDGNLLYENTFAVLDDSKFTSVEICDDGYIVSGQSVYSNMKVGVSDAGGAILLKYDKELNVVWSSNYGDSKTACYNDILIDDDYIYVVGVLESIIGIVSKYDMNGELVDTCKYEYTDSLGFTGIVYLDKHLLVSGAKKVNDSEETDAVIVKYELDLDLDEEIVYEGNGFERFNQMIIDSHDNVVVVGTSAQVDKEKSSDNVSIFIYDGLLGKYDKNLTKISVILYGDDRDDYFTDIIASDGNYLVSGYSSYEDGSYLSKFITYSDALKTLGVE